VEWIPDDDDWVQDDDDRVRDYDDYVQDDDDGVQDDDVMQVFDSFWSISTSMGGPELRLAWRCR
jgi:hypothetical protein